MTIRLGYGGAVLPLGWTPVTVAVRNGGGPLRGSIVVWTGQAPTSVPIASGIPAGSRIGQSLAENPQPSIAARHRIALGPGAATRYTTYLLDDLQVVSAEVVTAAGRAIASTQASPGDPRDGPQVAVLSADPQALDGVASITLPGPAVRIQVLHLTPATLPARAPALRAFSLVAIDDLGASLAPAQRQALLSYVASGGTLLVSGGAGAAAAESGLPASLRAFAPTGTEAIPGLPSVASELGVAAPAGPLTIATGTPNGATLIAEGATPILVRRPVGTGQLLFSAIDLDTGSSGQPAWPGQAALLEEVLLRAILPGSITAGWALAPNPGFTANGAWLRQALADLPSVPIGSLWVPGLVLAVYVLVCGPGVLWVLRRRRRPELAWAVIPLVAVVAAGAVAAGTLGNGASPAVTDRVAAIHLNPGTNVAYVESAVGVFARRPGAAAVTDASQPPGGTLIAALAPLDRSGRAPLTPVVDAAGSGPSVELTWQQPGALATFGEESFQPAPGSIEQQLTQSGDLVSGTITSHLAATLTGVDFVDGAAVDAIGSLAPGQRAQVRLRVPAGASAAGGLPSQLAAATVSASPLARRQAGQRQSVLYEVLGANVDSAPPTLVGWLNAAGTGLSVGGKRSRPSELEAVVVPLPPTVVGPQLGPGEVAAHVVGLAGAVSPYVTVTGDRTFGNLGAGASVTFELAVPGGVDPSRLALSIHAVAPATGSGLEASVFDPVTGGWEAVPGPAGTAAALPSAGDISTSGLLRVRVANTSAFGAQFDSVDLAAG